MRVRIFHNNHHLEAVRGGGYRTQHTVTEVYAYGTTTMRPERVCDQAWYLCNDGHRTEHGIPDPVAIGYRARCNRPLDTGDVIAVGERFYASADIGWMPIRDPLIDDRACPGTTPLTAAFPGTPAAVADPLLSADERHLREVLEQERHIPWTRLPGRGITAANGLVARGLAAVDTSGTWTLALPGVAVTT